MNRENLQGKLRENSGRENSGRKIQENSGGTIQLKKRKIHVDKIGNGKYNNLCACERNLLATIK